MLLVDRHLSPAFVAPEVIATAADPRVTTENRALQPRSQPDAAPALGRLLPADGGRDRRSRPLQKMNPQVRIIAASGLGGQDAGGRGHGRRRPALPPKPYTAEKLLKALAQLLHGTKEQ